MWVSKEISEPPGRLRHVTTNANPFDIMRSRVLRFAVNLKVQCCNYSQWFSASVSVEGQIPLGTAGDSPRSSHDSARYVGGVRPYWGFSWYSSVPTEWSWGSTWLVPRLREQCHCVTVALRGARRNLVWSLSTSFGWSAALRTVVHSEKYVHPVSCEVPDLITVSAAGRRYFNTVSLR
jgi:hypothetical protein